MQSDGVFIFIGYHPNSGLFQDFLSLDKRGYTKTDETMQTSVEVICAAGDVSANKLKQPLPSSAEGAIPAHYAERYILRAF